MITQDMVDISHPEFRQMLAERLRALGEPTRIHLLSLLMEKERSVGDLAKEVMKNQATISKHLATLHHHGFLKQRREGIQTFYSIADEDLGQFCHLMCDSLKKRLKKMSEFI